MPYYIIKLTDDRDNKEYFLEWSDIVEAPISKGLSREAFIEHYRKEYGEEEAAKLPERLEQVDKTGIFSQVPIDDVEKFIAYNSAGPDGIRLNKQGLLNRYCRNRLG